MRDQFINEAGYSVLRYWNTDVVNNLSGVLETLLLVLEGRPSPGLRFAPATLSPREAGEGKEGLVPSPAGGRGWRAAPGEGLLERKRTP